MKALLKDNDAAAAKLCRYESGKLRFKIQSARAGADQSAG